jgi:CRISPR-associated protein Csb1
MPKRHIFNVALEPVAGSRFQPTGFPDLGTGTFKKPTESGWVDAILVESEQSMANHLEGTAWENDAPHQAFTGLPYVRVQDSSGEFLTSSRTEAHRLSSAFIRESKLSNGTDTIDFLKTALNLRDDKPLSSRHISQAVLGLDPFCLVHGVFFADPKLPGQPKITRALTSFVEAEDVRPAEYGGVKKDDVRHKNAEDGGSGEGYGSIPFHRTMWTARSITGSFVIDLDQIRSYGLDVNATRLVEVMALWEVRALLDGGLRLRTMCDLTPASNAEISGLPSATELTDEVARLTTTLAEQLHNGEVLTVTWGGGSGKKKADKTSKGRSDEEPGDTP